MNTIFLHRNGHTEQATSIDRGWLNPIAGVSLWVDLTAPSIPESLILSDTFVFHRLAVEDAMASGRPAKVDAYDGYFLAVLHGADGAGSTISCFVGSTFMVSVHRTEAKAISDLVDSLQHGGRAMTEGPVALLHRIVDGVVDTYRPALEKMSACVDSLERRLFEKATAALVREMLDLRREAVALRLAIHRQRDVVERLARREFVDAGTEMAFRFRDVCGHLLHATDEAAALEDRLAGALTAAAGLAAGRRWM